MVHVCARGGFLMCNKLSTALPSSDWGWVDQWHIDMARPEQHDKDGWSYASDFPSAFHAHNETLDSVRRRRWIRTRTLLPFPVEEKQPMDAQATSNTAAPLPLSSTFHSLSPTSALTSLRMLGFSSRQQRAVELRLLTADAQPSVPFNPALLATDG